MKWWLYVVVLAGLTQPVFAQKPLLWLERAEQAERTVALEGVRRTLFFLPAPLPAVEEYVLRDGVRYRVEYRLPPERRGEVLIDDGVRCFRYIPRLKQVEVLSSEQPQLLRRRSQLLLRLRRGDFLLRQKGESQVAGRAAVVVEMQTRRGTPLRRWWIDREHGFILRMEEWTAQGQLRMRTEYVHLNLLKEVPIERFAPLFPAGVRRRERLQPLQVFETVEQVQPLVPFRIRVPRPVPERFWLTEVRLRMVGMHPLVSLHYTDETHTLVLFQTRLPLRADSPLWKTLADPTMRVEAWRDGYLNLMLVGNAPDPVFQQVREAIR